MKSSLLALPLFLLTFFSTTPFCLTAVVVSEQVLTRKNYCEYLESVANTKDLCGLYNGSIAAEGIIQTPAADGNLCYVIADGIDPEGAIHGLTRVQQKGYCDWIDDQKENKDTLCSLKNEVESNIPAEDQKTVIVISSSEKGTSPLMMFQESEKKKCKCCPRSTQHC